MLYGQQGVPNLEITLAYSFANICTFNAIYAKGTKEKLKGWGTPFTYDILCNFSFADFRIVLLKNVLVTQRWSRLKVSCKISSVKSQAIRIRFQDRLKLACKMLKQSKPLSLIWETHLMYLNIYHSTKQNNLKIVPRSIFPIIASLHKQLSEKYAKPPIFSQITNFL